MTIEAGIYKCRGIAGSEQYGSTTNGNDQIALNLDLFEIGQQVTTFLVFTDASAQFGIDRLRALGWEGDDLSNLAGIDKAEAQVQIKYEEYQGKQQMRVQILTGGGVVLQNQMNDASKRAFAAKFKSLATASRAGTAKPAGSGAEFPFGANNPTGQPPPQQRAGGVKL